MSMRPFHNLRKAIEDLQKQAMIRTAVKFTPEQAEEIMRSFTMRWNYRPGLDDLEYSAWVLLPNGLKYSSSGICAIGPGETIDEAVQRCKKEKWKDFRELLLTTVFNLEIRRDR